MSAGLCAFMLALAVVSASRVPERPLLPVGVALGATPLAMVPSHGLVGQGRDFLGLAAGIPILAAGCARHIGLARCNAGRPGRRSAMAMLLPAGAVTVFAVGQVADFYGTLRRYTVGTTGPLDAFAHVEGGWAPPLPGPLLVVAFVAGVLSVAGLCLAVARSGTCARRPWRI